MKKTVKVFSLALAIIMLMISICSCGAIKTLFMREDERAEFLMTEANKQFDPDKNHCTYYITVSVNYGGIEYTKNLVYDEYYDGKDLQNIKYKMTQQTNELDGFPTTYTFANGTLYISYEKEKRQAKFNNYEQASYYIPFYKVYYNIQSYAYVMCPQRDKGIYTVKYVHTTSESKANMYQYLRWAIPEHIHSKMYACQFVDEYTFDKKYCLTQYKTHIDLKPINSSEKGYVSIDFRQVYHYEDFTIAPPKDAESYEPLIDPI